MMSSYFMMSSGWADVDWLVVLTFTIVANASEWTSELLIMYSLNFALLSGHACALLSSLKPMGAMGTVKP